MNATSIVHASAALLVQIQSNTRRQKKKKNSVAERPVGGANIAAESTTRLQNKSTKSEMNEDNDAFSFFHFIFPSCAMTLDVGDI